ncbi:helix-turn-helix domain-containing protein [Christiangramia marina]|uniref:helix-turn-helix domain-containing protein n=1 Tax=Christiangramia marina TaxID=409436 RepID=UPI003AA882FF
MDIQFSNDEFLNKFGEQVRSIRLKSGLSYREMAQRCDLDYSYISKIEKGQHNIQLSTVLELAKGLEVHPQELFGFEIIPIS